MLSTERWSTMCVLQNIRTDILGVKRQKQLYSSKTVSLFRIRKMFIVTLLFEFAFKRTALSTYEES